MMVRGILASTLLSLFFIESSYIQLFHDEKLLYFELVCEKTNDEEFEDLFVGN